MAHGHVLMHFALRVESTGVGQVGSHRKVELQTGEVQDRKPFCGGKFCPSVLVARLTRLIGRRYLVMESDAAPCASLFWCVLYSHAVGALCSTQHAWASVTPSWLACDATIFLMNLSSEPRSVVQSLLCDVHDVTLMLRVGAEELQDPCSVEEGVTGGGPSRNHPPCLWDSSCKGFGKWTLDLLLRK
eukprot:1617300-Amphidinium_carterae.1